MILLEVVFGKRILKRVIYFKKTAKTIAINNEGRRLVTLIFLISSKFIPIPTINKPPTAVNSLIITGENNPCEALAKRLIPP